MKLSAVINCYNEEETIEVSILSIYDEVDEIVIVDNKSSDSTVNIINDIVKNHDFNKKIKFYPLDKPMQLADARNFCVSMSSNEWIVKWDGDFVAFGEDCSSKGVAPFSELVNLVRDNKENYDVFLLYSINISGDLYHCDRRRKYLGLSGDSFIARKSSVNYVVTDYPDTGLLRNIDGTPVRKFYLNNPEKHPIYFVHMYGVKPMEYHLYRAFMSQFQIWLANNEKTDFWKWLENIEGKDKNSALEYITRKHIENLEAHYFELPSIAYRHSSLDRYKVVYNGSVPIDRIVNKNNKINLYSSDVKIPYLSCANLNSYLEENESNIINLLSSKSLMVDISRNYCKGEGFNAPEEFIRKICDFYYSYLKCVSIRSRDPIILSNLIYLFPDEYLKCDLINLVLSKLSIHQTILMLSREVVGRAFVNNFRLIDEIKPDIGMIFALCFSVYCGSPALELSLLKSLIEKINNSGANYDFYHKLIQRRISSVESNLSLERRDSKERLTGKVLLLVGGQLRGFKSAVDTWSQYFDGFDVDCIVSTWDSQGFKNFENINLNHELSRFFDDNIVEQYINGSITECELETIYSHRYIQDTSIDDLKNEISKSLSWAENVDVNFHIEDEERFSNMTNPEKFYFHNNFLLMKSRELELSNYDIVIKIRPDLKFHTLNNNLKNEVDFINEGTLIAENNYFMAPWGFGVGDQLLAFKPSNCHSLLSPIDFDNDIEKLLTLMGKPVFCFHTLLAMGAWLAGLQCCKFKKYTRAGLVSADKISVV